MPQLTPEEEAKQLVNDFYDKIDDFPVKCGMYCQGGDIERYQLAKQCTLMAVEKILQIRMIYNIAYNLHLSVGERYEQVKSEIIKL